jgi:release factor glutamine methyltransferase
MVYEPAEDSLLLEDAVKRYARGRVLDMGTGSGVQALAAMAKGLSVLAADIDPAAVSAAKAKGIDTVRSDLFESVPGKFDTIVFNPPYLPDEPSAPEACLDGGPTGRELLDRFLEESPAHLARGGQLLFVQSTITGLEATERRLRALGLAFEVVGRRKVAWEELVAFRAWCV